MAKYALDSTFQALADPTRRAILARLVQGPASVTALAQDHDIALPSVLAHIRKLETGGLIRSDKTGRVRTCRIEPAQLVQAESWLSQLRRDWEGRLDRLEAYLAQTPDPSDD